MSNSENWTIRPAFEHDQEILDSFLAGAEWKHQHLDWLKTPDLLRSGSSFLAFDGKEPIGFLSCPPEPEGTAWLRVFAIGSGYQPRLLWKPMWSAAEKKILKLGLHTAAILVLAKWMLPLLPDTAFVESNAVIFYAWRGSHVSKQSPTTGSIRRIQPEDISAVAKIDHSAFRPIWRNSQEMLQASLRQASYATVIEDHQQIIAYQISTASALGAHLARLAVIPGRQSEGLGSAMVTDLLAHFIKRGFNRLTVNTQEDNFSSQRLYSRLGFRRSGERFPVHSRKYKF
jgi:[ribosomal protein S18]-alanine N-acetyltransferase